MTMAPSMVSVSWDDFSTAAAATVRNLHSDQDFTDVTIACEGQRTVDAHKVILSASSSFFHSILVETHSQEHPLICLTGVQFVHLQKLVEFIYLGEVKIPEQELASFLELGRDLTISGIIDQSEQEPGVANEHTEEVNTEEFEFEGPLIDRTIVPISEDMVTQEFIIENIKEEVVEPFEMPRVLKKEKLFECNKCDFTSVHYASVRKHKLSKHDGIKYQCEKCVKSFSDSSTLLRHKKSVHDGVVYRCDLCEKTFSDGSAVTRHKKKLHASDILPVYDPLHNF